MPESHTEDVPFASLECAEADSWAEIQSSVSAEFRDRFDVAIQRVEGAIVVTAPRTEMAALNRAWLPGTHPTATNETIQAVLNYARARGVARLLIHLPGWATKEGLSIPHARTATPMVKLYQRATLKTDTGSPLRIEAIGAADRRLFGEVAALGNEALPHMEDGFNSTVGQSGWRHYLAFADRVPVAAAAVRFYEDVAWCCFAGTLPEYRGRGAQRALLARRVSDAAAAGCRWVTCEALPDRPDARSVSLANMIATGFVAAYERPSLVVNLSEAKEGVSPSLRSG